MSDEHTTTEKNLARLKNFIGEAVLVFFLYLFFYAPGLVVNILYFMESKRIEKIAGQKPPGQGCLLVLLVWGIFILVGSIFFFSFVVPNGMRYVEDIMRELN